MGLTRIYFLVSCFLLLVSGQYKPIRELSRDKRALIWPKGTGKVQIIAGYGIPMDFKKLNVIFGSVLKANYILPKNVSDLRQQFVTYEKRKKRSSSRWDLYKIMEQMIEMRGMGGKSCILQAVCEVAQTPFEKNYGLFHEIIHVFFTPTTTNEKPDRYSDNEYYAAQKLGKKKENCQKLFPDCFVNLIELFTLYK